jgi:hypothetical protein
MARSPGYPIRADKQKEMPHVKKSIESGWTGERESTAVGIYPGGWIATRK